MLPRLAIRLRASNTAIRLTPGPQDCWRITRSGTHAGPLRLRHLRGRHASEVPAPPARILNLAQLIVPDSVGGDPIEADGLATFHAVVLWHFGAVSDALFAPLQQAREDYRVGCRGMRARCAALRQRFVDCARQQHGAWKKMGRHWLVVGGGFHGEIPDWLETAVDGVDEAWNDALGLGML